MTTLVACDRSVPPPASSSAPASIVSAYFVPVGPTPEQLKALHLTYDTFTMGPGGEYLDFVPLPPNAGDVVIQIKSAGAYKMKLIDAKCAYDVHVSPSEGVPFIMNSTTPTNKFVLTSPGQLTVSMGNDAANNYSCNINLSPM